MRAVINIKTDSEIKQQAADLADELGLTLSAVIQAGLKEFIRSRSLFVSAAPHMSPYLERLMGEATEDFASVKNISGPFSSIKKVNAYLDTL